MIVDQSTKKNDHYPSFQVHHDCKSTSLFDELIRNRHDLTDQHEKRTETGLISNIGETLMDLNRIELDEIVRILRHRYESNVFYTDVSLNTLIAVNPCREMPDLYSQAVMRYYHGYLTNVDRWSAWLEGSQWAAHIFKHASMAWQMLTRQNRSAGYYSSGALVGQTILVTGQSGSGKTRTINFILSYYAFVLGASAKCPNNIEHLLLNTNALLESFGNSRTGLNDNSSRFGKFIQLYFDGESNGYSLRSACLSTYMLEKTRSTNVTHDFNFHIFYVLLFGSDSSERESYELTRNLQDRYAYEFPCDRRLYERKLADVKRSFKLLNVPSGEVFSLISALAHLNCCSFLSNRTSYSSGVSLCSQDVEIETESMRHLESAARLLKFDLIDLRSYLLIQELTVKCNDDVIRKFCTLTQINQRKNCIVKFVYNRLFKYLVNVINLELNKTNSPPDESECQHFIGLLDMYGFENLYERNSFEQLCINYANEKLQQLFVECCFKLARAEFETECVQTEHVPDNASLLGELDSTDKMSLFGLINEQSILNTHNFHGADLTAKIDSCKFERIFKAKLHSSDVFYVKHYVGLVGYRVENLVSRNNDSTPDDMLKFMLKSNSQFLVANLLGGCSTDRPRGKKLTVLSKLKTNLDTLLDKLSKTNIFYVRCIKPNLTLTSDDFQTDLVQNQLNSCGLVALLNAHKNGFAFKFTYADFILNYRILFVKLKILTTSNLRDLSNPFIAKHLTSLFMNSINISKEGELFKMGVTKIFLKLVLFKRLEEQIKNVQYESALCIQSAWKAHRTRRRHRAAKIIQKWWKSVKNNHKYSINRRRSVDSISLDSFYSAFDPQIDSSTSIHKVFVKCDLVNDKILISY